MKNGLCLCAFLLILTLAIPGGLALTTGLVPAINPGHNSSQIFIQVGSQYITLQNAIDYGYLMGLNTSPMIITSFPPSSPYHIASKIFINVSVGTINYTMTLQEAIDNKAFIPGSAWQSQPRSYTTSLPAGGDYGYNINANTTADVKTLQYAIKKSLLSSSSCYGMPQGTACASGKTCDGSGHCLGWSGTGCAACPFGSQIYTPDCPGRPLVCPSSYYYCTNTYRPSSVSAECSYPIPGDCGNSRVVYCPPGQADVNWVMFP